MDDHPPLTRTRYRFGDYLFYSAMAAVPLLTGAVAIYPESVFGLVCYLIVLVAAAGLMLFFFCTHCPHYAGDAKRLKCMFFWGLPKYFRARPGPLKWSDKLVALAAALTLFAFPLAWLAENPGLLAIYLLSAGVFGATVRRCECGRCPFAECPVNKTGRQTPAPENAV